MMETRDPVLRGVVEMDETYVGGDPRPQSTCDDDSDERRSNERPEAWA